MKSGHARRRMVAKVSRAEPRDTSTINKNAAPLPTRSAIKGATPKSPTPTRMNRNEPPHSAVRMSS